MTERLYILSVPAIAAGLYILLHFAAAAVVTAAARWVW